MGKYKWQTSHNSTELWEEGLNGKDIIEAFCNYLNKTAEQFMNGIYQVKLNYKLYNQPKCMDYFLCIYIIYLYSIDCN